MPAPSGVATKVDSEPTTAAPTPAMWPSGSMASAFMLPKRMPMQKKLGIR